MSEAKRAEPELGGSGPPQAARTWQVLRVALIFAQLRSGETLGAPTPPTDLVPLLRQLRSALLEGPQSWTPKSSRPPRLGEHPCGCGFADVVRNPFPCASHGTTRDSDIDHLASVAAAARRRKKGKRSVAGKKKLRVWWEGASAGGRGHLVAGLVGWVESRHRALARARAPDASLRQRSGLTGGPRLASLGASAASCCAPLRRAIEQQRRPAPHHQRRRGCPRLTPIATTQEVSWDRFPDAAPF